MLAARNIHVSIGRFTILDGVDFTANSGAVTAIVGPNGSGKTTLLRAITGDVACTGQVRIGQQDTGALKPWQLAAMRAVLPQASTLAFPFTVIEVVRIGLQQGLSGETDRIAVQALARVGLAGYESRFYQELSGGEQQRVQLARVLSQVWRPVVDGAARWLLLDEPVSSLDIGHQLEVMDILRDFARAGGGVITVMHDLNLTALYADKVTMMARGQVLADGAPRDVISDANMTTAYGCPIRVNCAPEAGGTFVLPHAAGHGFAAKEAS
ncbi:MAG: heme ABC transporter ATP-binding protein [Sulfitobacter sp.]